MIIITITLTLILITKITMTIVIRTMIITRPKNLIATITMEVINIITMITIMQLIAIMITIMGAATMMTMEAIMIIMEGIMITMEDITMMLHTTTTNKTIIRIHHIPIKIHQHLKQTKGPKINSILITMKKSQR